MDLDGFRKMCYPDLPPATTDKRPVMLSVQADDGVVEAMSEDQASKFIVGLGGLLSTHFDIPAKGEGGMQEGVAFALSGAPVMFSDALPEENDPRIDSANSAIKRAQKSGEINPALSVFLTVTIR